MDRQINTQWLAPFQPATKRLLGSVCMIASVLLAGCSITPKPIIDQPITMRPLPEAPREKGNPGAIFQTAAYHPLFEDVRARAVGDSIIITISENTNSSNTSANATSKSASTSFSAPSFLGATASKIANANIATKTANSVSEKGADAFGNTFNGTIAVTIIEVLPNGNFRVSGEKKLAFDRDTEYVRFSGVVSPATIAQGNTVPSTQVADAKFEYRTNAHIDASEFMSIMDRFFLSILPM